MFLAAQQFYEENGHICVPKGKRRDQSVEACLARDLAVVRKALYADQMDSRGQLLRRQLTTHDVAKWDAACPGLWQSGILIGVVNDVI